MTEMSQRVLVFVAVATALLASVVLGPALASSQSAVLRTAWGHPDLQGLWDFRTITPLERPQEFGDQEFLTAEEAASVEQTVIDRNEHLLTRASERTTAGGSVDSRADGTPGFYNNFWLDTGTSTVGTRRTSLIIDPPNGRLPALTDSAKQRIDRNRAYRREHPADSWSDRPLGERCITFGAPDIWLSGYNSYWHIVQSKNSIAIVQEKIHDVRIIPIVEKPKLDGKISLWHGDSRGWWDGETLVIETTNFSGKADLLHSVSAAGQQIRGPGPRASERTYTERITRVAKNAIRYEITSSDPGTYQRPYTVEMTLDYTEDPIYEYACHEGNYGMANILSGHRAQERFAAESGSQN